MTRPQEGSQRSPYAWKVRGRLAILVLLCSASFVAVVDTTIVSIALPSIRHSLGFTTEGVQWVLNGYAVVFGGLLLMCGRLGDIYGRKRGFLLGLVVFGAASLLAGFAWNAVSLVVARLLQGAGAAAFVPASLSLLTSTFSEPAERSRAVSIYSAMAALGFVVGMVGGGLITETLGWRWIFLVNVPVAVVMIAAVRVLAESTAEQAERRVDVWGALTVTSGVLLLIHALTSVPSNGWSETTVLSGAAALLLLVAFVFVEQRAMAPLVPMGLVARPAVLVPNTAIALQSMIGIAWLYLLTLHFQEVEGRGPLVAGLLFIPMTLASIAATPVGGRLVQRIGVRTTAALGLAGVATGVAAMALGMVPAAPLLLVLAGMALGEAGFMLSNISLTVAGTAALDDERAGLAAGLLNTFCQVGGGLGLGIVAVVVAASLPEGGVRPSAYGNALQWGMGTCLIFALCALVLVLLGMRGHATVSLGARGPESPVTEGA
jgi:EmrB/QacA subfamily drug resistance transporter